MRNNIYIIILLFLFSCKDKNSEYKIQSSEPNAIKDVVDNFELPILAHAGQGALISAELIYGVDNKPTEECHSSSIIETSSGMLVTFFAGTHEKHPDVGIRTSRLVDGKWTHPEEVANGVENDTIRYPTWNPVLFQPKNGPLLLFYKIGPDPTSWWGMVKTSTDNGITWSKGIKLGSNDKIGHLLGPIKNKPIQLENGTIINPSSTESEDENGNIKWMVHFEISKDNGNTWQVVGPLTDGNEFDAIQPSILTYPNGKLQVLCRTRQDVIAESWSQDNGQTWSKMSATLLPNPNSGTDAVTLKDGRQLLIYNHTTTEGIEPKNRNMLNLAISQDGQNWQPVLTLENKPAKSGYSYPAIIQSSDGLVHATYTYMRETIKHVVIDPSKL